MTPTRPHARKFPLYDTERKDYEADLHPCRGKTTEVNLSALSKSLVLGKIGPLSSRNNPQKGPNIVKLSSYYKFMLSHSLLKGIKSNYYLSSEKLLKFMDANIRFCRNFYARYPKGLRVSKLRQIQLKPLTTDIKTIIFD
jgi:Dullard-like phosphatase family protein